MVNIALRASIYCRTMHTHKISLTRASFYRIEIATHTHTSTQHLKRMTRYQRSMFARHPRGQSLFDANCIIVQRRIFFPCIWTRTSLRSLDTSIGKCAKPVESDESRSRACLTSFDFHRIPPSGLLSRRTMSPKRKIVFRHSPEPSNPNLMIFIFLFELIEFCRFFNFAFFQWRM